MPNIAKQPKNSRRGCRVGLGKRAEKQPEKPPKHLKNSQMSGIWLSAPKSLSRTPEIAAISETRESNAALRFKGAMESR